MKHRIRNHKSELGDNNQICFVLMPFDPMFRWVYDKLFKKTAIANGLECVRVDDTSQTCCITKEIVGNIHRANVIIADISTCNPNVFYELGVTHALGNKTVMVSRKGERFPFDISAYKVIPYVADPFDDNHVFISKLDRAIKTMLLNGIEPNNPVQDAFYSIGINNNCSTTNRIPLFTKINMREVPKRIRELFTAENLHFVDELEHLDFDAMKTKYNLGVTWLGILLRIVAHCGVLNNSGMHTLALKYGANTSWRHASLALIGNSENA